MRRSGIILGLLFGVIGVMAQTIEGGTVYYQRIVDLGIKPEGEWAEFKKSLPKTRTMNYLLYFSKSVSLFLENPNANEAPSPMMKKALWFAGAQGQPQVIFAGLYINFDKNIQVRQTEFMTRLFLEQNDIAKLKWKMGQATKEILGYTCMQAETEINVSLVLAWFTPAIPVSFGPENYFGLPGLILEANVNQGQQVWLATSIDLTMPSKENLEKLTEGRKVNAAQYQKIQEDKIAEWENQVKMNKAIKVVK